MSNYNQSYYDYGKKKQVKRKKAPAKPSSWPKILKKVTETGAASAKRRKKQYEKALKKAGA